MITDARALRPEFVPQDLHHRDGQIDYLSSCLKPVTVGNPAEDVVITGPSGAGKTTIAKYVLSLLKREALSVRWGYVNCMADSSRAASLFHLVRDAGLGADLQREGMHAASALEYFRQSDDQIICVVDEVDIIDDPQVLLSLFEVPNVSLIMITLADETQWLAGLDPRAKSRIRSSQTLRLEGYTHAELIDILNSRVEHGLISARINETAIDHIADIAAGDARHGITLLRRAARYLEENDRRELSCEVVDAVLNDAEIDMIQRRVRSLGSQKRLLYEIIRDAGEISAAELHERYDQQSSNPRARSTRRKYLNRLRHYDLIESDGVGRSTVYRYPLKPQECATSVR